jgi:single-strand DNA-binding protein
MSLAKVFIVGNLGRDAELKYLGSGTPVLEFPVAANERWRDQSGNMQEHTQWFRVSIFGRQAESLKPYLLKGKQVFADGRLRVREYTDREGKQRYSCDVRADNIQLLGRRDEGPPSSGEGGYGGTGGGGGGSAGGQSGGAPPNAGEDPSFNDDDVPF